MRIKQQWGDKKPSKERPSDEGSAISLLKPDPHTATEPLSSQFDFIQASSNMGHNASQQNPSVLGVDIQPDGSEDQKGHHPSRVSSDGQKGQLGTTTEKLTSSIIGQGNALVDRIKKSLHIESLEDGTSSSGIYFSKDAEEVKVKDSVDEFQDDENQKSFGDEEEEELHLEGTNELQHSLEYSSEEKFQILQQGHSARIRAIREKQEILKSEVMKITTGRIQSIFSITKKHRQLQETQAEQMKAIAVEDYERAESLAMQCAALESELNILPDMSLNTHFIMEELLKSALELQRQEKITSEKMITETKRLHQEEGELAKKFKNRLSEIEVKDKEDLDRKRLELEKEESHFKDDLEKFKVKESELEQKIAEKTQDLEKKKSELELEREKIQREIKEQEEKLLKLRQTEVELSESIAKEEENIAATTGEYRSEVSAPDLERQSNLARDAKIQEMKREVLTLEEKRNQQLQQHTEHKERHEKLEKEIEQLLETEEESHRQVPVEVTWSIQSPPSFHPTPGLTQARLQVKDHEEKTTMTRTDLVHGQKKVATLKKQLSDLEGHIAELEQSKKLAVEGKQFTEAKSLSEEIKKLTGEGKQLQEQLEDLTQKNHDTVVRLQQMHRESEKLKEAEDDERSKWEEQLREKLTSHFETLYEDGENAIVKHNCAAAAILQSELQTSCLLLNHLCQKLNFGLTNEVSDKVEEVLRGVEACDPENQPDSASTSETVGAFSSEIQLLQTDLKEAVKEEDFDTAEDLQKRITHFEKANLET